MPVRKGAVVLHSGGMDSSLCLALAIQKFGTDHVIALCFRYGQRHEIEIQQAQHICREWGIYQEVADVSALQHLVPPSALTDVELKIEREGTAPASTMVVGRNGLMAQLGGIYAHRLGYNQLYMGIIGVEGANSGYRDCSRNYIDLKQAALRLDLDDPEFAIHTPLVHMTKCKTMHLGYKLGVLDFLLEETISCYEGILRAGCRTCPACLLRNEGIETFCKEMPNYTPPYSSMSSMPSYSKGWSTNEGKRK